MWTRRPGSKLDRVSHVSCAGVLLALFSINTLYSLMAADDPKAAAAVPSEDHRKSTNLVLLWSLMGNSTLMSIQIENVALKGIIERPLCFLGTLFNCMLLFSQTKAAMFRTPCSSSTRASGGWRKGTEGTLNVAWHECFRNC